MVAKPISSKEIIYIRFIWWWTRNSFREKLKPCQEYHGQWNESTMASFKQQIRQTGKKDLSKIGTLSKNPN
jgi:hypothetical protein